MTDEAHTVSRLKRNNWLVLVFLAAGSGALAGPRISLSVLCGGLVSIANFNLLYRVLRKTLVPGAAGGPASVVLKYYLRLIGTGVVLLLLIKVAKASPIALLVGLSTVVINLVLFGLFQMLKYLKREG